MRRTLLGQVAGALVLCFLGACESGLTPQDEKDLATVAQGCFKLAAKDEQTACIGAAVRLTGKTVPETSLPKAPALPVLGIAKQEIRFRDLPVGQPIDAEKLIAICPKTDGTSTWRVCPTPESIVGNCPKYKDPLAESACRPTDDGVDIRIIGVQFGNQEVTPTFHLDKNRTVHEVSFTGTKAEMSALIMLLAEKYGPPKLEKGEVQNGLGNRFETVAASWTDSSGTTMTVDAGGQNGKVDGGTFLVRSASQTIGKAKKLAKEVEQATSRL